MAEAPEATPSQHRFSRRRFVGGLGAVGAAGAGAAVLGTTGLLGHTDSGAAAEPVPFFGPHQAGIATPAQDRLVFGSFDVVTHRRTDLVDLLQRWTAAAARMSRGEEIGRNDLAKAPPDDTGEAVGLAPGRLTITFGFGPTLFTRDGTDRFGIAARRPAALEALPAFPHDNLDPTRSGGDLAVQACADDPQVAFHALRNLARIGRGVVALRWTQLGFGRTSSTSRSQETPRNLMGFKDGTNNLRADDATSMQEHVWVGAGDQPAWMHGGTYLVARRIRMRIETWDRSSLDDQEQTIGRAKQSGAPLGRQHEFDTVDLAAKRADGFTVVPADAHIRVAAPASNRGAHLLRRGYSFSDGIDARTAELDAGLFFIAFQRDPRTQFVPIQRRLAAIDALNEYIVHTGSAVFAVPPGVTSEHGFVGESLFT